MPPPREDDAGNVTDDVADDTDVVLEDLHRELGGPTVVQPPSSPVQIVGTRKRPMTTGRRPVAMVTRSAGLPSTVQEDDELVEVPPKRKAAVKKNSEVYPKEDRPPMFEDDEVFDRLSGDKAADIVLQFYTIKEKKALKNSSKCALEKTDDKLKKVKIAAGEDDAGDVIHVEARKKLRPVNKEVEDQMEYFVRERTEIIRNLPLAAFGLQDIVPTKSIELAHNLASTIKLEQFSPNNLKSAVNNQKQKAYTDKEGKLIVESNDMFGEMENTMDVLKAWLTLDSVWSRIFPEWPVAKIGMRVCLNMKMFAHCGGKAKDVMLTFSNRLLASNSSRAANKKGPLIF